MKHYVCSHSIGRIAGVRDRLGIHFYTDSVEEQRRIERHPLFERGMIKLFVEPEPEREQKPTDVGIESLDWNGLKALAKERGISIHGKKKAQILEELNAPIAGG